MVDKPTLSGLIDAAEGDIDGRLSGADSRLRRSLLGVIVRVIAGMAFALYGYVDKQFKNLFADTADTEHLRQQAADYGIEPQAATFASGPVTVPGLNGTVIEAGTVLQRSDSALFTTAADVTVTGGTAALTLTASVAGLAGNTSAGSTLSFVSPIANVSSTGTVAAGGITGGADEESDASLLARLQFRKRNPPKGGAKSDYEIWAGEAISGVTRSWPYPNWIGAGTVGLTFVFDGRDDIIPTSDDVADMLAYIQVKRPVTATPVVFAPVPNPMNPVMTITPDTPATRAAVTAEMKDLITRLGEPGGTLPITQIRESVAIAAGITDYNLTSPTANFVSAAGHIPTLGTPDFGS